MPREKESPKERYYECIGRRKSSVARVRVFPASAEKQARKARIMVNERELAKYFPLKKQQQTVEAPLKALSLEGYGISVKVEGGGTTGQTEAIRLGIARALVRIDPAWRPRLKVLGFLRRDPRVVERKKPGLRKARRPQQWRKR